MAAARPLVAALAMCCLYQSFESITTPRILAGSLGATASPLMAIGAVLVRFGFLVKCISMVFSPSDVAPLRLSQSSASSMMV